MLRLIVVAFAALCLFGTSSLALAEDAMKGEMKAEKDVTKGDMKGKTKEHKGKTKEHKEKTKKHKDATKVPAAPAPMSAPAPAAAP